MRSSTTCFCYCHWPLLFPARRVYCLSSCIYGALTSAVLLTFKGSISTCFGHGHRLLLFQAEMMKNMKKEDLEAMTRQMQNMPSMPGMGGPGTAHLFITTLASSA